MSANKNARTRTTKPKKQSIISLPGSTLHAAAAAAAAVAAAVGTEL